MGFRYHDAIGELIYAVCTSCLDISAETIKLSQYCASPAKIHFLAVHHVFYYLWATIDDGIYYWHQQLILELPDVSLLFLYPDNYDLQVYPLDQGHPL